MNLRLLSSAVFGLALGLAAYTQDAPINPPPSQSPGQTPDSGGWQGQRGGRGGGGFGMMMGHSLLGTVTAVGADHYTIKTEAGEAYVVHFSANTRIIKQSAQGRDSGAGPQLLKPTDIKVGNAVAAVGEIDATAKSVGAVAVMLLDPERARQLREMEANYGKTWLMGKITAVDGVKVTLFGSLDSTAHSFIADENTTFRKRREPITLADLQVGDAVRVEGAVKDGIFLATTVNAMGAQGGNPTVPRGAKPPAQPQ